jgi:DNA-binding MarR family transcriptional regulator
VTKARDQLAKTQAPDATATEAWRLLCDLVLDNERRRQVSDAVGLSFGRLRVLRRVAARSMPIGELAASVGVDPPNMTSVVDDLESLGLVRRQPHPTDRRAKLVVATPRGQQLAKLANAIMSTPPTGLAELGGDDLAALVRILRSVAGTEFAAPGQPYER